MGSNNSFTHEDSAKGRRANMRQMRIAREERWQEIEFLLEGGMSPEEVAKHVGVSVSALAKQAARQGWKQRARIFDRIRVRNWRREQHGKAS